MNLNRLFCPSTTARSHSRLQIRSKPIVAIALLACSISLLGCQNALTSPPRTSSTTPSHQVSPTRSISKEAVRQPIGQPISTQPSMSPTIAPQPSNDEVGDLEPEIGIIQSIDPGVDLCTITFTDDSGIERQASTIDFCGDSASYLNQRVRLIYGLRTIEDCPSHFPCDRTRRANLVVQMDLVDENGMTISPDSVVLSNGSWTITVGNRNSWSGVNRTGNLSYRGCNAQQSCLELTGGQMSCRLGTCSTLWQNGDYTYVLSSPITDGSVATTSTLVVRRGDRVLREISGLAAQ